MAHLHEESGQLFAIVELDSGKLTSINLSKFLPSDNKRRLPEALVRAVSRQRPRSQNSSIRRFTLAIGDALVSQGTTRLPSSEPDWQILVSGWFEYHFLRDDTKQSLRTALSTWNDVVAPTLERIQLTEGLIPLGVVIPRGPNSLKGHDTGVHTAKLIGDESPAPVSKEIRKLLIGIDLSRTDPQYLDEIHTKLFHRRTYLHDCLEKWWEQVKAHYEYGQSLLNSVSWIEVQQELDLAIRNSPIHSCGSLTLGDTRKSLARQLAVFKYHNNGGHSGDQITASPYVNTIATLRLPADCPIGFTNVNRSQRVSWMLGQLGEVDVAVCSALLVMHNPKFTPYAVLEAKIRDRDGKPYLELGDDSAFFRVEKPRANSMKESELDAISIDIIETICQITSPLRAVLRSSGSKLADYLFLTTNTRGESDIADNTSICTILTGDVRKTIYRAFPQLEAHLPAGSISLKKIRATEGVLEWFRTGSIQAMRRKLGNTTKVVLKHYLPEPLLAAWNTRLIRRFQNLWIAVAAAGEPFLLEVTDFNSMEELNAFIADMLKLHGPTSSHLAIELHRAFGDNRASSGSSVNTVDSRLCVSISGDSLYYLYLYQESALNAGIESEVLERIDPQLGLCPKDFLDLAELVKSEVAQRGNPDLRNAHESALLRLNSDSPRPEWSRLMLELGAPGRTHG